MIWGMFGAGTGSGAEGSSWKTWTIRVAPVYTLSREGRLKGISSRHRTTAHSSRKVHLGSRYSSARRSARVTAMRIAAPVFISKMVMGHLTPTRRSTPEAAELPPRAIAFR